jgi:RimJ/RimL family protein N-acetyltransferase
MHSFDTARLTLRPWSQEDVDFVFDLYSRWEVQRFIGSTPRVLESRAEAQSRLDTWMSLDHPVNGIWAVEERQTSRVTGVLLLKPIPASRDAVDHRQDTEIGWHFHPRFWGRGYASEAAAVILRHAFDSGLPGVVAVTNPANSASRRVCARIGMRHLGQTTRYYDTTCELYSAARESPFLPGG